MSNRNYGQFCGLARAMELVGERWALLVIRDLVLGPKRFSELRRGLPRIPTNILSARLKELEESGVVRRTVLPRPAAGLAYELTTYGKELEEIILRLGLWGAKSLGDPRQEEIVTPDSLTLALRATFDPDGARGLKAGYELRAGPIVIHARVDDGTLMAAPGPLPDADLVIEAGPEIRAVLAGELSPAQAMDTGAVHIQGDPKLLDRFVQAFRIPPLPVAVPA